MRKWLRRILTGLLGLLAAGLIAGATYEWAAARRDFAATPPPGRLIDVGGHRLHIWCTGEGTPAVVLESGLGGSSVHWGLVQPEVARFTRVCSYDRAGLGYSDPGPSPRTARQTARELAALVDRAGVAGPLVIVAASSGGFTARMLASEQEQRVAGLVLADATHEDQHHEIPGIARYVPFLSTVGLLRLLGISFSPDPESLPPHVRAYARATAFRAAGYRASAAEVIDFEESANEIRAARRRLTIPVVVVTAGRGDDPTWRKLQRDQVDLSERGCQVIAANSGHRIHDDAPEVIVEAVRRLVDLARGAHDVAPCGPDVAAR